MAYKSSTDAVKQLLFTRDRGGVISKWAERIITLPNGPSYYFAEVRLHDGSSYLIGAMGEEALELYKQALKMEEKILAPTGRAK